MTLREKLEIEHPECIDEKWHGGCKDCPSMYGYCTVEKELCDCKTCDKEICTRCWNQEYDGELTPQEKMFMDLKKQLAGKSMFVEIYRDERDETSRCLNDVWRYTDAEARHWYPFKKSDVAAQIKESYDRMKSSRNIWRAVSIGFIIGAVIGIILRLFGG